MIGSSQIILSVFRLANNSRRALSVGKYYKGWLANMICWRIIVYQEIYATYSKHMQFNPEFA